MKHFRDHREVENFLLSPSLEFRNSNASQNRFPNRNMFKLLLIASEPDRLQVCDVED